MTGRVLLADIGGTRSRFGVTDFGHAALEVYDVVKLANDDFTSFDAALKIYLNTIPTLPEHALFAIAGPVKDHVVKLTNRDWSISAQALKAQYGFKSVTLVNDFEAMARAVPVLDEDRFETVLEGDADPAAPVLVAGPGTGLGMATLLQADAGKWKVICSEGGHSAFAPRSHEDVKLGQILHSLYGFVSYELVTSGSGLEAVHRAMCKLYGEPFTEMAAEDVSSAAQNGNLICERVCAFRARALMGFIGDMVLANGARGGAVLSGGATESLLPWLGGDEAQTYYLDRGPRSEYIAGIPIRRMRGEFIPLVGAAALYNDQLGV